MSTRLQRRPRLPRRPRRPGRRAEEGQISVLVLGLALLVVVVISGVIAATSVHLARTRLLDAADTAALTAANTIDPRVYTTGVDQAVPLSDQGVVAAAGDLLASQTRPATVKEWSLAPGTGSPDGYTAVVRLTATVRIPLIGGVLDGIGQTRRITVESHARAPVR